MEPEGMKNVCTTKTRRRSATTRATSTTTTGSGGTGLGSNARGHSLGGLAYTVSGTVYPVVAGATVTVEYEAGSGWTTAASGTASDTGRYSIPVLGPGIYRVLYNGIVGPKIAVG